MKQHFNIKIYGRVQGVGYRRFCQREAQEIGISGFVKNMPDGSVYIEAEGEDFELENFLLRCRQGPPLSRVNDIKISQSRPEDYTDFIIRYA